MIQPRIYFIGDNIFPIYHILIPNEIFIPGFCIGIQHRRIWITIDFYQLVNCFSWYSNVSWINLLEAMRSIKNSIYRWQCDRSVHTRICLYYSHSRLWRNQRRIQFYLLNLKYGLTVFISLEFSQLDINQIILHKLCIMIIYKYSWYNQHVDILAPACIVSVDFVQSTNWFRGVKGSNPVSLYQFVFHVPLALSPCRGLNVGCNWNEYQMCIQHIWSVTHIRTFIKF